MSSDENVVKLANKIVQYETKEKGFFGKLFAFESRDGFLSKLAKSMGPILSGAGMGALAYSFAAGPLGPVIGTAIAVAAGLSEGLIDRAVNKSVFSDMHDSQKTFLGKLAHLILTGVPAAVVNFGLGRLLGRITESAVTLASTAITAPLLNIFTSKGVGAALGNKEQRQQSEQARQLAEKAMETGQSVEALVAQEKTVSPSLAYKNSVTPEEYEQLQNKVQQKGANDLSTLKRINTAPTIVTP